MQNVDLIKEQICDVCHKMWQLGWVAANDGNVSARLPDEAHTPIDKRTAPTWPTT